jgi:2-methylcitrate dehydratase PrpD
VQSSGLVEALGTMAKSVSVGNAARNGLMSAALAARDFTGPAAPLLGTRGWLRVHSDAPRFAALTEGLGTEWEIARNTYKPYPAGVVLNPVLDACLDLRDSEGLTLDEVASVTLTGHPLLRQRTDRPDVRSGRESQVSCQHAVAIALLRGRAGLDEFTDDAVAETLHLGRPTIEFRDEEGRDIASVDMVVRTRDGRELRRSIDAARGSRGRPLSDAELEQKLEMLAARAGFPGARRLADAIWSIERLDDAGAIMRLARGA